MAASLPPRYKFIGYTGIDSRKQMRFLLFL